MTSRVGDVRIVFVGAVRFSEHCLREVFRCGGNVVSVFTLPPEGAARHSDYVDLGPVAQAHGVPTVYLRERIFAEPDVSRVRDLSPDVIMVLGWSELISGDLISIPRVGCIGTHPALLLRNRGRHPLIWALADELKESGLTFFFIDEGTDTGGILWQKPFPITQEDDAGTLYKKIEDLAAEAIGTFLPQLAGKAYPREKQDDRYATYLRKRAAEDEEIKRTETQATIFNLVRASTHPYPGAHTFLRDTIVRAWPCPLPDADHLRDFDCGEVLFAEEGCLHVAAAGERGVAVITDYEMSADVPVSGGDVMGSLE